MNSLYNALYLKKPTKEFTLWGKTKKMEKSPKREKGTREGSVIRRKDNLPDAQVKPSEHRVEQAALIENFSQWVDESDTAISKREEYYEKTCGSK